MFGPLLLYCGQQLRTASPRTLWPGTPQAGTLPCRLPPGRGKHTGRRQMIGPLRVRDTKFLPC